MDNKFFIHAKQFLNKTFIQPFVIRHNKKIMMQLFPNLHLSIISSNCIGGVLYHDYGLEFLSPTINMAFNALDFVKFCNNMEHYLNHDIVFEKEDENQGYPIIRIDDILIKGVHYKNFEHFKEKWDKRKGRINRDNILYIMTNQDGCDTAIVDEFEKLQGNKVLFTNIDYKKDFEIYLKSNGERNPVDDLFQFVGLTGKRRLEKHFDLLQFLKEQR